jgi:AcrR family transcriptional regulator
MTVERLPRVRDPERRERILGAAAELIAERGFQGVNMDEIGTAAGIVGSGVYRHFDRKSAILVELFERIVDGLVADAETALREGSDPSAVLRQLVEGQIRFTVDERILCRVYLNEAHHLPTADQRRLRWKQRHYIDLWQDVLMGLRHDLTAARAQLLVNIAIGGIHSVLRSEPDFSDPGLTEELAAAAERVLAVPEDPAGIAAPESVSTQT